MKPIAARRLTLIALLIFAGWYVVLPSISAHYRTEADKHPRECPWTNTADDPDHKTYPSQLPVVKIIALTDSGELVARCKWTDTLYEVKKVTKPKRIFIYVHGWRHSADPKDSDFRAFSDLVAQETDKEVANGGKRHVIGIYVGWDAATPIPGLEYLTFWDRKLTADRISQSAIFAKLIGALRSILAQQEAARPPSPSDRDQLVVIGHSFGARIVYSALAQAMIMQVQAAHPGEPGGMYKRVLGAADAVVLLNPALEAGAYTAFDSLRRYKESFSAEQRPLFLTISTDNDSVTGTLFPIGQWVSLGRSEREMTTIGNYREYFTHVLSIDAHAKDSVLTGDWPERFCSGGICLNRTDQLQERNPFFVATTTSAVLDGHNGIWSKTFTDWLVQYIDALDKQGPLKPNMQPAALP